jgi:hypothetical protein
MTEEVIDDVATEEVIDDVATEETTPSTILESTDELNIDDSIDSYWPKNWREICVGDDPDVINQLLKFTSPKALAHSYLALQKKMGSKLSLLSPPPNATEEQLAAWREQIGIPKEATEYQESLKNLPILDADKSMIEDFLNNALGANLSKEQVAKTLGWFYNERQKKSEEFIQNQYNRDSEDRENYDKMLRQDWGAAYSRNKAAIAGLLPEMPEELQDLINVGRLPDGTRVGNNPAVLSWLANAAMELNPTATVVPGGSGNSMAQIDSEIASIEKRMRNDRDNYFKDAGAQQRYLDLITARDNMKSKQR